MNDFFIKKRLINFLRQNGILRLLAFIRHAISELRFAVDYLIFKFRYRRIISYQPRCCKPLKTLLVVGIHGFIPCVKDESILAKALQAKGFVPVILVKRNSWAIKYYRLFGFQRFVYWEDWLDKVSDSFLGSRAEIGPLIEKTFQDLLKLKYRGADIGRHVLSLITRIRHRGKIDLCSGEVMSLLKELVTYACRSVKAAEAILDEVRPEIMIFAERGYTPFGEIFDIALSRNINVVQWDTFEKDDSKNFKRYTYETRYQHPHSLSADSWESVRRMKWNGALEQELFEDLERRYASGEWFNYQRLQHGKTIKSKKDLQGQLGLDPGKKTAVIFSHVLWDATFFYGDSLFDDYEEWLVETVRVACGNPAVNWIVKLHPVNVWRLEVDNYRGELAETVVLRERVGKLPEHIKMVYPDSDINTFSFFRAIDYCLTVRGTIGLEMAAFGVPVFTAGTGRYSGLGFTIDSIDRRDYLTKLRGIQAYPPLTGEQTEQAKKYLYGLLKLRPLRFSSYAPVNSTGRRTFHPLNPGIVIHASSARELENADDLRCFAEWAVRREELDFMRPLVQGYRMD